MRLESKDIESIKVHIGVGDGGWYYEIDVNEFKDVDGGLCTGSLDDAVSMACGQASAIALMGVAVRKV
jgi:hypothetical protein